jgi:exodeoxyribonuclease-3
MRLLRRAQARIWPTACLALALLLPAASAMAATPLTLMTFNLWGAGRNEAQSTAHTVAVLRAAAADIVGLQETRAESEACSEADCPPHGPSVARELAQALGYHCYEQDAPSEVLWSNAVLSRYPIIGPTPLGLGVRIDVDGKVVHLFNIHATDYPYQPFQLLGIAYGEAPFIHDSAAAIAAAQQARGGALRLLRQDLASAGEAALTVVTGDFNEPSWRDWTAAAVAAGLQPLVVPWPLTAALEADGFTDAYRAAHPDEVASPGFTWSPTISAQTVDDHRDRIDFIFVRGPGTRVVQALVVGESAATADIVVTPWPSDHRAVVAKVEF